MFKYLLICLLAINVTYASGVKLVDYIVSASSSGLIEVLAKKGIVGDEAKQVQSYVVSSLKALGIKEGANPKQQLEKVLGNIVASTEDMNRIRGLQGLLDTEVKNASSVQEKQLVAAINSLIYVANRYGSSVIITCAECVNPTLAAKGFQFTVETIKNATSTQLLEKTIPKNPADLSKYISKNMKGMGDYSKVTPDLVAPQDEKTLALFVSLRTKGTEEQKSLVEAIVRLSTKNGKANIIDPKDPHQFWKIVADDMTPEETASWVKTLDEVTADKKGNTTVKEAFYKVLKEKAGKDPELMEQYKKLEAKGCFFK